MHDDILREGPRKLRGQRKELINEAEQLRLGTIEVRNVLGSQVPVTDKEIQDSLWHTYYDVEKTAAYLLNVHTLKVPKKEKKSGELEIFLYWLKSVQ